jgi:hypothetical protein
LLPRQLLLLALLLLEVGLLSLAVWVLLCLLPLSRSVRGTGADITQDLPF